MLQAAMFDGLLLDGGAPRVDLAVAAKVSVGGYHIAQALVIALMVVVLDERLDLGFGIAGQVVIFSRMRLFNVWYKRSILHCLCRWKGGPRTWLMASAVAS